MGVPVMVMGASGSGKSASLRNFTAGEVGVFNVASKLFPFRNNLKSVNTSDYKIIEASLQKNNLKAYVIDDAQYLMCFEGFARAKETGYGKFTDIGLHFYNLVKTVINSTSQDTIVYFLQHTERGDDGYVKAKTIGKMLDNQLTLEGLFTIVLLADITQDGKHIFKTTSDGYNTAKAPMDMFQPEIDNDLKAVDTIIREYYGMEEKNNEA